MQTLCKRSVRVTMGFPVRRSMDDEPFLPGHVPSLQRTAPTNTVSVLAPAQNKGRRAPSLDTAAARPSATWSTYRPPPRHSRRHRRTARTPRQRSPRDRSSRTDRSCVATCILCLCNLFRGNARCLGRAIGPAFRACLAERSSLARSQARAREIPKSSPRCQHSVNMR